MARPTVGAPESVWLRAPDLGDIPRAFDPAHAARILARQERTKTADWLPAEAPAAPAPPLPDSTAPPQNDPKPLRRKRTPRKPR